MAPSCILHPIFKVLITVLLFFTVAFIFFLTVLDLPAKSEMGLEVESNKIGSKPPACENKCMKCRPCMATLVAPNHQRKKDFVSFRSVTSRRGEDDDTYYLLSWKCRCGNKFFQP